MKTKFNQYLNHPLYFVSVYLMFFAVWLLKFFLSTSVLLQVTCIIYIPIAMMLASLLYFYEDTYYTIPFIFGFLFSIGFGTFTVDSLNQLALAFIAIAIFLIGFILHFIKYPIKIKPSLFLISYGLTALSFFIALLGKNNHSVATFLSLSSILYILLIIMYQSLNETRTHNDLMRTMFFTSLLLTLELLTLVIHKIIGLEGTLLTRIEHALIHNHYHVGWSNINDLTLLLVFFSASILYYIFKYPKRLVFFMQLGLNALLIFITFSRGSMVTMTLMIFALMFYIFKYHSTAIKKNLFYTIIIAILVLLILHEVVGIFLYQITHHINMPAESLLSSRLNLWHLALDTFRQNPIFGAGLGSTIDSSNRVIVFHSTFFHVLATGGLFGLTILIFHFFSVYKIFKSTHNKYVLYPILLTFILTQMHGLIDNTQYMIFYTISTIIVFSFLIKDKPYEHILCIKRCK